MPGSNRQAAIACAAPLIVLPRKPTPNQQRTDTSRRGSLPPAVVLDQKETVLPSSDQRIQIFHADQRLPYPTLALEQPLPPPEPEEQSRRTTRRAHNESLLTSNTSSTNSWIACVAAQCRHA